MYVPLTPFVQGIAEKTHTRHSEWCYHTCLVTVSQ